MVNLEEYCNSYEQTINEKETFDINYNDSGISKMIKKFLNWFLGSTDKETYNPYNSGKFNSDATGAKIQELKSDGVKMELEFKEINSYDEFRSAVDKSQSALLNIHQIFNDSKKKEWKAYKFGAVHGTMEGLCADLPIVFFVYKYSKDVFDIKLIEVVDGYRESIFIKDFISKLKSFIKKVSKRDYDKKLEKYSIRIVKYNAKTKNWSFDKLLEYMANDSKTFSKCDVDNKELEKKYISNL